MFRQNTVAARLILDLKALVLGVENFAMFDIIAGLWCHGLTASDTCLGHIVNERGVRGRQMRGDRVAHVALEGAEVRVELRVDRLETLVCVANEYIQRVD
jgi:hypothetical protein